MADSSDQLSSFQISALIIWNTIFSGISLTFCISMIVLYLKNRVLKNFFTKLFFFLMISEAGYSLGKFISVFKFVDSESFCLGGILCALQGFLICSSELSSFLWIVYIAFSFLNLLKYHEIQENSKLRIVCLYLFPILVTAIFGIFSQLGSTNESQSIWCWIKINPGLSDNILMFILYLLYLAFIVTNIAIYVKIDRFLQNLIGKQITTPEILHQVTRYLKRTSLICIVLYSIAFANRVIQVSSLSNDSTFLFILYIIHIMLLNSKGSLFFLFCLEKKYRQHLSDFFFWRNSTRDSSLSEDKEKNCLEDCDRMNNVEKATTGTATIESYSYTKGTLRETINN